MILSPLSGGTTLVCWLFPFCKYVQSSLLQSLLVFFLDRQSVRWCICWVRRALYLCLKDVNMNMTIQTSKEQQTLSPSVVLFSSRSTMYAWNCSNIQGKCTQRPRRWGERTKGRPERSSPCSRTRGQRRLSSRAEAQVQLIRVTSSAPLSFALALLRISNHKQCSSVDQWGPYCWVELL